MDTIVALSSGAIRAAIAIVRMSGPQVRFVLETIGQADIQPRRAQLIALRRGRYGPLLDQCLVLFFPGPHSATGEDVLELHVHGGAAVIEGVIAYLNQLHPGIRLAEPGEFTRRALESGKLDLLQVEALSDVLSAESAAQLVQAQRQMSGELGQLVLQWRERLVDIRALLEAGLDFSDEGDVDDGVWVQARTAITALRDEIAAVLGDADRGIRVRDGLTVVISGPPNVGKSSLMNALARRDVAIVSPTPGTTRDVLETRVDFGGVTATLIDTAGLRVTGDAIEAEGVRRARARANTADVVVQLWSADEGVEPPLSIRSGRSPSVLNVQSKVDISDWKWGALGVSTVTGDGLPELHALIAQHLKPLCAGDPPLVARERQRDALAAAVSALERAILGSSEELVAEDVRLCTGALARLTGHLDIESVLDRLFEGFCIGK